MAIESKWEAVPEISLISDGTTQGQLEVNSASDFKVKMTIILVSNTQPTKQFQIKRIVNGSLILVGELNTPIHQRSDVSSYLVSDNARLYAQEQQRPNISPEIVHRNVYEEEPTVALRTMSVDEFGNKYGPDNPMSVQLSDGSVNIGSVNAELEVQLDHSGPNPDSVQIGDGEDLLVINPDGSININAVPNSTSSLLISTSNEITSVAAETPTNIVTYTAPVDKLSFLHKIFVSGNNTAEYKIKLNGDIIDIRRTYFGNSLNETFDFSGASKGKLLTPGDIINVEVEHSRPYVGNFNARIQSIEI